LAVAYWYRETDRESGMGNRQSELTAND